MKYQIILFKRLLSFGSVALYCLPGMPAFYAASWGNFIRALGEFVTSFVFSLLPLFVIYGVEVLRSNPTNYSFSALNQYIDAGQIFFYVGPIIGGIFYLVLIDLRKNLNNLKETEIPERFWFLFYLMVCPIASVVILVLHHAGIINNNVALIYSSIIIYVISLYFSFVNTLYGHLGNNYKTRDDSAKAAIAKGLVGFNGEN